MLPGDLVAQVLLGELAKSNYCWAAIAQITPPIDKIHQPMDMVATIVPVRRRLLFCADVSCMGLKHPQRK